MLKNLDYKDIFKYIIVLTCVVISSFGLSGVAFFNNNFTFIVPFVIFCLLVNKWLGFIAYGVSYLYIGNLNGWFYLLYLLFLIFIICFKWVFKNTRKKMKQIICFSSFFITLIEGLFSFLFFKNSDVFMLFLSSVASYWIMCYFYDLYVSLYGERKSLYSSLSVFVFTVVGIVLLGVNLQVGYFNLSLIGIVFLGIIASKVGLDIGVLYSFLMVVIMRFSGMVNVNVFLFISACAFAFLLNKTSKITFIFTYSLFVFAFVYKDGLDYIFIVDYIAAAVIYFCVPYLIIDKISCRCFGTQRYIEKIKEDSDKFNVKLSNRVDKMKDVFSLVCGKINVSGRIKKNEKKLLTKEVVVFEGLMEKFALDIKDDRSSIKSKFINEMYRYGIDVLYFDVVEDIFKDKMIKFNVKCSEKEVDNIVFPFIKKFFKCGCSITKFRENVVLGCYEFVLKLKKGIQINLGVSQRASEGDVCGDSYLFFESDSKRIFALSDGMGTGKGAKNKSKLALDLLKKFVDIGFEVEQAIVSINYILKGEYERDSYATLDLFVYDKDTNEFYFYKNGAANSYVISNDDCEIICGDELPVGIVDNVEVKKCKIDIKEESYIIMVSDGVSEIDLSFMKNVKSKDPQRLSSDILNLNSEVKDDQTVLVLKIKY